MKNKQTSIISNVSNHNIIYEFLQLNLFYVCVWNVGTVQAQIFGNIFDIQTIFSLYLYKIIHINSY